MRSLNDQQAALGYNQVVLRTAVQNLISKLDMISFLAHHRMKQHVVLFQSIFGQYRRISWRARQVEPRASDQRLPLVRMAAQLSYRIK